MQEELNRIIDFINSRTDWGKLEKMRFAYIELGKLIHKDVFFFYTIQNNLLNGKEEFQYDIDTIEQKVNSHNAFDYKVICKNSADMLKYIYDHVGIECELRKTTKTDVYKSGEKEVLINHYFLVATGDNDKKYIMTINPDIYNIKISKKTSHFGCKIPYKVYETITKENGEKEKVLTQVYEGEEIDGTPLSPEELKALDLKIGYNFINYNGKLVYTDELLDALEKSYKYNTRLLNDGEYFNIVSCETPFYYDICNLLNGKKSLEEILESDKVPTKEEIDDSYIDYENLSLDEKTLSDLKFFILFEVVMEIYNRYKIGIDEYILDDYKDKLEDKDYRSMLEAFTKNFTDKNYTNLGPYNPIMEFKKTILMLKTIDNIIKKENNIDRKEDIQDLRDALSNVLMIFVPEMYLPSTEERLNSSYITNKIIKSFEKIFDIGHVGEFNKLELAEQIDLIKEILLRVFSDPKLNIPDPSIPGYRPEKSPLFNRVYSTVLFNKETHDPYYLMIVRNSSLQMDINEGSVPIVFDLKRNTISIDMSMTDIFDSFFIIKDNDFKLMIEQTEEDNKSK